MGGLERREAPSGVSPAGVKAAVAAQSLPHSHSPHLLHIPGGFWEAPALAAGAQRAAVVAMHRRG